MTKGRSVEPALASKAAEAPSGRLALSGRLTIVEAETVREGLVQALAGCQSLSLETAGLEAVDVAGLQLLIAARRSAERAGKSVRLAAAAEGALLTALIGAGFRAEGDSGRPDAGRDDFWWGRS